MMYSTTITTKIALAFDIELKDIVITGDFNLNYLYITFRRSLINLKTVKFPEKVNATT